MHRQGPGRDGENPLDPQISGGFGTDESRSGAEAFDAGEPFRLNGDLVPPNPVTSEIETLEDVARSSRQVRHARAAIRSHSPSPRCHPSGGAVEDDLAEDGETPAEPEPETEISLQERPIRITEGDPPMAATCFSPRPETLYGAHGIPQAPHISGGGTVLKAGVPRAPFINSPIFIGIVLLGIFLLGLLIWDQRVLPARRECMFLFSRR